MRITTEDGRTTRVFKSKYGENNFYTSISKKLDNGEYTNHYINLRFKKDSTPEIDDFKDMVIKDGFLTFDEYEVDGVLKKSILIQVMNYEVK